MRCCPTRSTQHCTLQWHNPTTSLPSFLWYVLRVAVSSFRALWLRRACMFDAAMCCRLTTSPSIVSCVCVWQKSGALTCPLNANRETPMAFVEKGTSREADLLGSIVDSPLIRERVKDDDSTECQQCFNKFSFSRKKVGCRHCGAIVCRSCTKKKPIRKYGLDRDQVVCDQCARFLGSSYSSRR